MKRLLVAAICASFGLVNLQAGEWRVKTRSAGEITVACQQPDDWKFDVRVDSVDGKEILTVTLVSAGCGSPT